MSTLNMDRIVELLTEQGVTAYVAMTGGGVATIYAGPTRTDADGDVRYAAVAGPGTYNTSRPSVGDTADFYVGADDDGATDETAVAAVGATDETAVAALIAAQTRLPDPTQPLDDNARDLLAAMGADQ